MIPFVYNILLFLMLLIIYNAAKELKKNGARILSRPGICIITAYSLNEGLRFGRGIDYCNYWPDYEELAKTGESTYEIGFHSLSYFLAFCGLPFQALIMLLSILFILSTLFFMKSYKDILPWALVLFCLFSLKSVENMIRWYAAFSFVLIGLHFLLHKGKINIYFIFFILFSCLFHVAMIVVPILFYIIWKFKRPLLPPIVSIILFFVIAITFESESMAQFADMVNELSAMSDRFQQYGNKAEYWLTSGYHGMERQGMPATQEILFLIFITYFGYKVAKSSSKLIIYAYNLFLIGLLLYPISRQIELLVRFQQPFFFFRGIVLATIIYKFFIMKNLKVNAVVYVVSILILLNESRRIIAEPFYGSPIKYMYVWNREKKHTADYIHQKWWDEQDKGAAEKEKFERREKRIKH